MIDNTQILLVAVVTVLTALLAIIGVQVFFILREIRESIKKFNKIIDDAGTISGSIAQPIASLSNSITGVSGIAGLLGWLSQRKRKSKKTEKEEEE